MYDLTTFGGIALPNYRERPDPLNKVGTIPVRPRYGNGAGGVFMSEPTIAMSSGLGWNRFRTIPRPEVNEIIHEGSYLASTASGLETAYNIYSALVGRVDRLYRTTEDGNEHWMLAHLRELSPVMRGRALTQGFRFVFETLEHSWRGAALSATVLVNSANMNAGPAASYDGDELGNTIIDDIVLTVTATGGTCTSWKMYAHSLSPGGSAGETVFSIQYNGSLAAGQSVVIDPKNWSVVHSVNGPDYGSLALVTQVVSSVAYIHNAPQWFFADASSTPSVNEINKWYFTPTGANINVKIEGYARYA